MKPPETPEAREDALKRWLDAAGLAYTLKHTDGEPFASLAMGLPGASGGVSLTASVQGPFLRITAFDVLPGPWDPEQLWQVANEVHQDWPFGRMYFNALVGHWCASAGVWLGRPPPEDWLARWPFEHVADATFALREGAVPEWTPPPAQVDVAVVAEAARRLGLSPVDQGGGQGVVQAVALREPDGHTFAVQWFVVGGDTLVLRYRHPEGRLRVDDGLAVRVNALNATLPVGSVVVAREHEAVYLTVAVPLAVTPIDAELLADLLSYGSSALRLVDAELAAWRLPAR